MGNIKNYNFNKLDFKLSNSDYWDFFLNNDAITDTVDYTSNIIAGFDFSDYTALSIIPDFDYADFDSDDFYATSGITSLYEWDGAFSSDLSASTFGLTGLDNGAIHYDANGDLLRILTGATLVHTSGDTKLFLKLVSGATGNYIYPTELVITTASTGNYLSLCGGFLQGYYKLDGYDYQTLPDRFEKGFTISTWLNPTTGCTSIHTGTTLNDTYSGNTGFFFYMGTRAENKFWNVFTGITDSGCTSASTIFCTDTKETDILLTNITYNGSATTLTTPLSPPPEDIELVTNNFMILGRSEGILCDNLPSPDGLGQVQASDLANHTPFYTQLVREKQVDFVNQFLLYGRSEGILCDNKPSPDGYGQTQASGYSGATIPILELPKDDDLPDNAFGFRIKDDGSIGYRLLTLSADCKSVEIVEEYSLSGMVGSDQWSNVTVKWVNNDQYTECDLINGAPRKGKFKFYVNGFLIFSSKELNEYVGKRLYELQEKQIGVPYNVSIGGGTQGLIDSITFDGQDPDDLGLIVESNFAGTFIGYIADFYLFDKNLSWCEIKDIYNNKKLNFI